MNTKSIILNTAGGAALFAAGYFVRSGITPAHESAPSASAAAPVSAGRPAPARAEEAVPAVAVATNAVRPFTPGRPFAKGHAKAWIASLLPSLSGDRRGYAIASMNLSPLFSTMDGEALKEALAAIQEMSDAEDIRNPARRRNPNGDGGLDYLKMLALLRMVKTDPDAAVGQLKENWEHNDGSTRFLMLGTLAMDDPARAEQVALTFEDKQRRDALKSVVHALTGRDPEAALAFADRHTGLLDDGDRENIFEGWVRRDPASAMAAASRTTSQSGNPEFVRNTVEEWYKVDPSAATAWAATYDGPGKTAAKAMILERELNESPQAALDGYATLLASGAPPKELERLTSNIARSLAGRNIEAARAWVETLPAGGLQKGAIHRVASEWVKTDAPAASEWIKTLPSGDARDGAAVELSSAISQRDPLSAFEWARSIGDGKLRAHALQRVMESWKQQDPDAAKAALDSLPADQRPGQ